MKILQLPREQDFIEWVKHFIAVSTKTGNASGSLKEVSSFVDTVSELIKSHLSPTAACLNLSVLSFTLAHAYYQEGLVGSVPVLQEGLKLIEGGGGGLAGVKRHVGLAIKVWRVVVKLLPMFIQAEVSRDGEGISRGRQAHW